MGGKNFNDGLVPDKAHPSNLFFGKDPSLKKVIGSGINWLGGVMSGGVSAMQNIKPPMVSEYASGSKDTYGVSSGKNSVMNGIKPPHLTNTSAGIHGKKTWDGYNYSVQGAYASGKSAGICEPRNTSAGYTVGNSTMKDTAKKGDTEYLTLPRRDYY